jgi:transposase-like protein
MHHQIHTDRERRAAVARWRRSGLPAHEFALVVGVSPATLYAWSRRFRGGVRQVADIGVHTTSLVELVPTKDSAARMQSVPACDTDISLALRSGRTLHFPSHVADEVLRRLIAVAESA